MQKCEYGCDQEAKFQLVSGKWCCSKFTTQCSELRRKDSEKKKGKIPKWKNGHPKGMLGRSPWNKGLNKTLDSRCNISAITRNKLSEKMKLRVIDAEKEMDRIRKIKESAKLNGKMGGKRIGSGRGKKGWYKGFFCDSSWELAFVIYNIDNNIEFRRNKEWFHYLYEGKKRKFYPDFIMNDGIFVEIKGYMTKQNASKLLYFKNPIIIIDKKGISPYLKYVQETYGKNFIELYDSTLTDRK